MRAYEGAGENERRVRVANGNAIIRMAIFCNFARDINDFERDLTRGQECLGAISYSFYLTANIPEIENNRQGYNIRSLDRLYTIAEQAQEFITQSKQRKISLTAD
ncbi:MAG: hypothetical protein AAF549_05740 [Pseudomonadota bacterium]